MAQLLRALTASGIDQFRAYLAELRDAEGPSPSPPVELLDSIGYSTELPVDIDIEARQFPSRLEVAKYLDQRLRPLGAAFLNQDAGIWAWLSLFYFDQVCPVSKDGTRRPGQDYRHIPKFEFRYRHRHLLHGPYQVYRRHGVKSILLLTGSLKTESGLYHEIASRQDLIANLGAIEAAIMLYFDPQRLAPKRGAQAQRGRPGTVRRFVRVLQQLDMTFDIYGLSGRQILDLLPSEFDEWRPGRRR
jgi:hypothetical protein